METQAWHLKRLLSFTKNRLANRPHRPRDPALRDFLSSIGFEWPEPEQSGEGDDSDGDDSSYEYSDSSDSEDGVSTAPANASKGPTKLTEALGGTLATYNMFFIRCCLTFSKFGPQKCGHPTTHGHIWYLNFLCAYWVCMDLNILLTFRYALCICR